MFSCSYRSESIRKGEYLSKAIEKDSLDFLQNRMKNRIKKVQGANWEILFEDNNYIYYGYPLISFFREGTFVEEFYRTDQAKVKKLFPLYRISDGVVFRKKILDFINEHVKKSNSEHFQFSYEFLFGDLVLVQLTYHSNRDQKRITEKYQLTYHPSDLKQIHFEKKN